MSVPLVPREQAAQDALALLLRDLVHEHTGIYFEDGRLDTMLDKLGARKQARKCGSYLEYYYILKYDRDAEEEWHRVMDAFSVQETYFWREYDQIAALVQHVIPLWFKDHSTPFRIWSAACASGEEPYSIAMALVEAGWGNHPIEILATDASEAALAKAQARVYRERSFRTLPPELRAKYFETGPEGSVLRPEIASRITFRWANLMDVEQPLAGMREQAIFCRNVFIYFSADSIKRVAASFAQRLPAGGQLFIGSSESLLKVTDQFDLQEIGSAFVYVRNDVQ